MPRVVHFEINAADPEKAVAFYSGVFGWKSEKWEGPFDYWMLTTGAEDEPGINGAIMSGGRAPIINTIDVASLDEALKAVEAHGGKAVGERQTIPGVGYHIYCADPEGNLFGMMEEDINAS